MGYEYVISKVRRTKYGRALIRAAEESYQNEVVDTGMEKLTIGEDGDYDSKEDWMDCKIAEWLDEEREAELAFSNLSS